MALTKLAVLGEEIVASIFHGLITYFATNKGNIYKVVNSTGVCTLLDTIDQGITSLAINHPTLYVTTNQGKIYTYAISSTSDPYAGVTVGANANVIGSGVILTRSGANTAAGRLYCDDGGAVLWGTGSVPDIRGSLARTLLTVSQTGGNIRVHALMGQLKSYDGKWNGEVVSAVHGRLEIQRASATLTLGGYGVSAAVLGIAATTGAVTVDSSHVLAGVAAICDFKATLTQTGKTVAFLVAKYDTTNWSDGTSRTTWGTGLYMAVGSVTQAIQIGEKASAVGSGLAVNAAPSDGSGIAGIIRVFGDDGGVVPGNTVDINAIESRFLIGTDLSSSACSIKAMRGHLRVHTGKLPTGSNAGLIGYLEIDGTSVIGTGQNAAVMGMVDSTGGAVSGAANSILSAFCATTTGSFALTTARSTVLHVSTPADFTSIFDIAAATGFVTTSQLTGGTTQYLTIYIANKAYTIACTTTS
jgi:hypothetical protein